MAPVLEARSLNHWTVGKSCRFPMLIRLFYHCLGELSEIINDSESVRQKAVKKNGNNTSDKGLEKMHNHFKMKMAWKEKGIKEVDYQNVIRKKKCFWFS